MSVVAPNGFAAASGAGGLKAAGKHDLALVVALGDDERVVAVPAAATFTTNFAAAAPVRVSRAHLGATQGRSAAVVINAGNANAVTGPQGMRDAEAMTSIVAGELGVAPEEVLVCSTGLIGIPLAMGPVAAALPGLAAGLAQGRAAGHEVAQAIMTTDTVAKETVQRNAEITVGGMAKGAAMLAPNMATMLAVLTTDAACEPAVLSHLLRHAVSRSFNAISVDGSTSTNDTVIVLAGGRAGPCKEDVLGDLLDRACADLAAQMVADAEGSTKTARVTVTGARSEGDAAAMARRVGESDLVKCSLNGADPYWGRIVSELGSAGAGVDFDVDRVTISYGGIVVCRDGVAVAHDESAVATHMAGSHIEIVCDVGLGDGEATLLATDLGYGYIDENRTTS